jgi:hypothetical protein
MNLFRLYFVELTYELAEGVVMILNEQDKKLVLARANMMIGVPNSEAHAGYRYVEVNDYDSTSKRQMTSLVALTNLTAISILEYEGESYEDVIDQITEEQLCD